MNILFIKYFCSRMYSFIYTESVRIRALSVFSYFPLCIDMILKTKEF